MVPLIKNQYDFYEVLTSNRGGRGVMVIVAGCGHGDTSSNPGQDWLHFSHSTNTLEKGMNPIILPPAMGK